MANRTFYYVNFGADYEQEEQRTELPREPESYSLTPYQMFNAAGEIVEGVNGSPVFANSVSSRTNTPVELESSNAGMHMPAIDIDLPIKVVPSKTDGHFHLYIEKEMDWVHYLILLLAFAECGIVEPGYVSVCMQRRASFLRLSPETPR